MFGLSNISAGMPFPANAWMGMQAAQGSGQVCPQFNAGQWGFQHPNNNATWGGATTNNFFWNQGLPQMAQSPAQQVINQPLALLTYPAQPTPMQQYHITPVLPDSMHKPEQDMFNSVPAQLTTVKTQQEEATQRISHLETALKAQQMEAARALSQHQEALKHVTDQMAGWHTWWSQEDPPHQSKRFKTEPAVVTQAELIPEQEPKLPPAIVHRPTKAVPRSAMVESKTNVRPGPSQTHDSPPVRNFFGSDDPRTADATIGDLPEDFVDLAKCVTSQIILWPPEQ